MIFKHKEYIKKVGTEMLSFFQTLILTLPFGFHDLYLLYKQVIAFFFAQISLYINAHIREAFLILSNEFGQLIHDFGSHLRSDKCKNY